MYQAEDGIRESVASRGLGNMYKRQAVTKAHAHFFIDIKPTTGFYEISKLVAPEYLVEIEFTAIVIEKPLIQEGL